MRSRVSLKRDGLQFGRGLGEQRAGALGEAAERVVVMHHRLAIGGELDVAFDGEIAGDRGLRRARHVLDDAARRYHAGRDARPAAPSANRARA